MALSFKQSAGVVLLKLNLTRVFILTWYRQTKVTTDTVSTQELQLHCRALLT